MQVTHVKDHITHAVIGGSQTIDFGIANSAEFFNILSTSLYTDQILAVVREVICNAWDAHIEAGIQDTPIKVTISDSEFTVQDFGNGIPKDKIGEIYGVYGQSSKKDNGEVTGGFGLGCKSPFAYTDHFEVTSCNGGTKTIYQISKSSAQVGGKPGITPVINIPTTETGLTVKVRLKYNNKHEFFYKANRVIRCGEIRAEVNGVAVKTIPYSEAKHGFTIVSNDVFENALLKESIYVKYGHVIYPIPLDSAYGKEYFAAQQEVNRIVPNRYGQASFTLVLILHAKPHSISITPSREALSLQERTVNTISTLLKDFNLLVKRQIDNCYVNTLKLQVQAMTTSRELLSDRLPRVVECNHNTVINTVQQIANYTASYGEPKSKKYTKLFFVKSLERAIQNEKGKRGLLQSLLKEAKKRETPDSLTNWFLRKVYTPLISDILRVKPNFDAKSVLIRTNHNRHYSSKILEYSFEELCQPTVRGCLLHVDNVVILTTRKNINEDRLNTIANHKPIKTALIVHVSREDNSLAAIRKMLLSRKDTTFIDMTVKYDWESNPDKVAAKRQKGVPVLSNAIRSMSGFVDLSTFWSSKDSHKRTDKPKFVLKVTKGDLSSCDGFEREAVSMFYKHYGSEVGVCRTVAQLEKYKKMGIPRAREFVLNELKNRLSKSKALNRHFGNYFNKLSDTSEYVGVEISLVNVLLRFPEVAKPLNLYTQLSEEDHALIEIFNEIRKNCHKLDQPLYEVVTMIDNIKPTSTILKIADVIKECPWLQVMDTFKVMSTLRNQDKKSKDLLNFFLKTFN